MHYLGTNFSLTLGAWRLRFVLALEDAPCTDAGSDRDTLAHEQPCEHAPPHVARFDPHAAGRYRN
jgi:hypothetical protein